MSLLTADERRRVRKARARLDRIGLKREVPIFPVHQMPTGCLSPTRAAHACWFYYIQAQRAYEKYESPHAIIQVAAGDEWKPTPDVDYREMFIATVILYGCKPERILGHMPEVDKECERVGLSKLPSGDKYRFDAPMILMP